jgi:hypothetical protein
MLWFVQYEGKSQPYSSLREACRSWGLNHTFGNRIEPGVYRIRSANKDVLIVRVDRLQNYSRFLNEGGWL